MYNLPFNSSPQRNSFPQKLMCSTIAAIVQPSRYQGIMFREPLICTVKLMSVQSIETVVLFTQHFSFANPAIYQPYFHLHEKTSAYVKLLQIVFFNLCLMSHRSTTEVMKLMQVFFFNRQNIAIIFFSYKMLWIEKEVYIYTVPWNKLKAFVSLLFHFIFNQICSLTPSLKKQRYIDAHKVFKCKTQISCKDCSIQDLSWTYQA